MPGLERPPNILLIAADGLNADHMSVYGYERETTPYIKQFTGPGAVFCENAFANAGNSGASIIAMMTGKTPLQTKVYYPPDILHGEDAYEHMPAILRSYGYRNFDVSIRHYADPYDMNMRNSFDEANFRRISPRRSSQTVSRWIGGESEYFLGRVFDRVANRYLKITGQQWRPDAFDRVMGTDSEVAPEKTQVEDAVASFLAFIDESPAPFFAHLHLLPTHGPKFNAKLVLFSDGQEETEDWMTDFYDDAVLTFDAVFGSIMRSLRQRGFTHNTLVILHSDHGMAWSVGVRLPLIFVFPGREHTGRVVANVQNLDIPATVLDYLGIPRPAWMGGVSLISQTPPPDRPVITTASRQPEEQNTGLWVSAKSSYDPPFYNLGKVGMVLCDRYYLADLVNPEYPVLTSHAVPGHTAPCGEVDRASEVAAFTRLFAILEENGFDLSSTKYQQSLTVFSPSH